MPRLQRVDQTTATAEITRPDVAKVISGDPVHTTWNIEDADGLYCGLWQSTPGKWRVSYTEWEYVHIHSGHSILTDEMERPPSCARVTVLSFVQGSRAHGRCWKQP